MTAAPPVDAWFTGDVAVTPLGEGFINDTWRLTAQGRAYVLQRINETVFPDPREVAAKVARVVRHLEAHPEVTTPALVACRSGALWHEDARGGVWRLWRFVTGTRTLERLRSAAQGEAAGRAFGGFQRAIADLPGAVAEPIPGFLRLSRYLEALDEACRAGAPDADCAAALEQVGSRRDLARHFVRPDRLIHGDCKISNLLFRAERDDVACVIDLDTVMHGHWAWDFGDLVRSAAADGDVVNVERFAAIARGFVSSGAVAAGRETAETMVLAPRHVTLMLAVRFLADHLLGDRYFKVHARGDNLQRASTQLVLLRDMERRERAMRDAIRSI